MHFLGNIYFFSKKIILSILLVLFAMIDSEAQVYYVSSSQGNDLNDGLSIQTPLHGAIALFSTSRVVFTCLDHLFH